MSTKNSRELTLNWSVQMNREPGIPGFPFFRDASGSCCNEGTEVSVLDFTRLMMMTTITRGKKRSDRMRLFGLSCLRMSLGFQDRCPPTCLVTSVKLYSRSWPLPLMASMIFLGRTIRVVSMCLRRPKILQQGADDVHVLVDGQLQLPDTWDTPESSNLADVHVVSVTSVSVVWSPCTCRTSLTH